MSATIQRLPGARNGDPSWALATRWSVSDAAYQVAHAYPGGIPALAQRMPPSLSARGEPVHMSANTLQHKVNPNCNTHHLSLEEARDISVLSGDFRILHALSADLSHMAIRLSPDAEGVTLQKVMRLTKEFGELLSEVARATEGTSERGARLSHNEMMRIETEAGELISAANGLVAAMRAQMGATE